MHRILMNFTFMSSDSALHAAASSWQVTVELHYHLFNKARLCKNVKFYNDSLGHQRQLVPGLQDPPPWLPKRSNTPISSGVLRTFGCLSCRLTFSEHLLN